MAVSPRIRFEVFKRDDFTCRYCGRKTPEVVLQVDHIVPLSQGGKDDVVNLTTSCWECNSGKSDVPLSEIITGEDPTDRAILLLEQRRQLDEYNYVLATLMRQREDDANELLNWWCDQTGDSGVPKNQFVWLVRTLQWVPATTIKEAMLAALKNARTRDWRYVMAVIRNWRQDGKLPTTEPS